jgi:ATP-dependent DNA helicase RecG
MIVRHRPVGLSAEEVVACLDAGQGERVAFLPAKAHVRSISETLAAMANGSGGVVLLGVAANGTVQKGNDAAHLCEQALEAMLYADPPLILPAAQAVDTGRGVVAAVQTPPGLPHVYNVQGVFLTRAGSHNRPLSTAELRRLLLDRGESGFESQPATGAALTDLDPLRIERYLDRALVSTTEDPLQALVGRGCLYHTEQGELAPTIAGILLFGVNPQRFLRSAEIVCVRYDSLAMSDEFVRQEIGGTLAEQIRQAEAFVTANMRRGMRIAALAREETTEYPLSVVREAIVNAVAHRDYSIRGEGIRLLMFSDRLEIYSPGRLPGHVTLENLKDERYSRNEAIVAVLGDLGYIERLGYGIDRMIAAMQEAGLDAPCFEESAAGFKVTLRSAGGDLVSLTPDQHRWGHSFLNDRQERAMAYIRQNGRITNSELQEMAPEVSPETIRRDLADLVEKNLLLRIGSKRATYYILK